MMILREQGSIHRGYVSVEPHTCRAKANVRSFPSFLNPRHTVMRKSLNFVL